MLYALIGLRFTPLKLLHIRSYRTNIIKLKVNKWCKDWITENMTIAVNCLIASKPLLIQQSLRISLVAQFDWCIVLASRKKVAISFNVAINGFVA